MINIDWYESLAFHISLHNNKHYTQDFVYEIWASLKRSNLCDILQ